MQDKGSHVPRTLPTLFASKWAIRHFFKRLKHTNQIVNSGLVRNIQCQSEFKFIHALVRVIQYRQVTKKENKQQMKGDPNCRARVKRALYPRTTWVFCSSPWRPNRNSLWWRSGQLKNVYRLKLHFVGILSGCRAGIVVRALTSHQCGLGSIPTLGVICGLSLLILYSAPRGFSPGTPVCPSP